MFCKSFLAIFFLFFELLPESFQINFSPVIFVNMGFVPFNIVHVWALNFIVASHFMEHLQSFPLSGFYGKTKNIIYDNFNFLCNNSSNFL